MADKNAEFEIPMPTYDGAMNIAEGMLPPGTQEEFLVEQFFALAERTVARCAQWAQVLLPAR